MRNKLMMNDDDK